MLHTRTLLKSMCSCILITLLIKSITHATPVAHVTNVVLPEAHPYFVPNPALDKHADTVHRRLKSLGDLALVYPLGIEDHEQQVASQHVRTWLEGQVHVQNLLHLGSRRNSHTYAFLLPETPEAQRLVGGGMDPASARMGVFTVHLDRGNRAHDGIYVNGFLGLERVQDRNALEHRMLASPKTHDLESLLIGRIHGF
ncbi:uncharacterized protein UTRI_06227 [Ustilago trichophora]|uniref:Uncharacterized protein n=1 Tax=Ustilago trichophora TaxID=86804 RepID=A0A5C3EFL0_9BASI|nr:uncharacterized protein UTRI_06227 [Ustilago trichophora]